MSDVLARLEAAQAEVARLQREVAQAHCGEVGHDWRFLGGKPCGCDDGWCSIPVYECSKCGDCDYGDNDEADEVRSRCDAQ